VDLKLRDPVGSWTARRPTTREPATPSGPHPCFSRNAALPREARLEVHRLALLMQLNRCPKRRPRAGRPPRRSRPTPGCRRSSGWPLRAPATGMARGGLSSARFSSTQPARDPAGPRGALRWRLAGTFWPARSCWQRAEAGRARRARGHPAHRPLPQRHHAQALLARSSGELERTVGRRCSGRSSTPGLGRGGAVRLGGGRAYIGPNRRSTASSSRTARASSSWPAPRAGGGSRGAGRCRHRCSGGFPRQDRRDAAVRQHAGRGGAALVRRERARLQGPRRRPHDPALANPISS